MAEDKTLGLMDVSWAVADLLRRSMASHRHRKVILPFALLRQVDCRRRQEAGTPGKATVSEADTRLAADAVGMAAADLDGTGSAPVAVDHSGPARVIAWRPASSSG
ncbi:MULTISPECIES: hypothetical protein [Streptomyces]|uniref:hypothetical protein n=1 Tax=Streptomyces TaxID=1883 RepID=UPI0033C3F113